MSKMWGIIYNRDGQGGNYYFDEEVWQLTEGHGVLLPYCYCGAQKPHLLVKIEHEAFGEVGVRCIESGETIFFRRRSWIARLFFGEFYK